MANEKTIKFNTLKEENSNTQKPTICGKIARANPPETSCQPASYALPPKRVIGMRNESSFSQRIQWGGVYQFIIIFEASIIC